MNEPVFPSMPTRTLDDNGDLAVNDMFALGMVPGYVGTMAAHMVLSSGRTRLTDAEMHRLETYMAEAPARRAAQEKADAEELQRQPWALQLNLWVAQCYVVAWTQEQDRESYDYVQVILPCWPWAIAAHDPDGLLALIADGIASGALPATPGADTEPDPPDWKRALVQL